MSRYSEMMISPRVHSQEAGTARERQGPAVTSHNKGPALSRPRAPSHEIGERADALGNPRELAKTPSPRGGSLPQISSVPDSRTSSRGVAKSYATPPVLENNHTGENYANAIAWLADAPRDAANVHEYLTFRVTSCIKQAFEKESSNMRDNVTAGVEKEAAALVSRLESQQARFVEQQAGRMQAILEQLQNLNKIVADLQEKRTSSAPNIYTSHILQQEKQFTPGSLNTFDVQTVQNMQPQPLQVTDQVAEQGRGISATASMPMFEDTLEAARQKQKHLVVTIISCTGLQNKDTVGKSDPYCVCKFMDRGKLPRSEFRTEVVQDCLNPVWQYTETFSNYKAGDCLSFHVLDKDAFVDGELGHVTLTSSEIQESGRFDGELELLGQGDGFHPKLRVIVEVRDGRPPKEDHEIAPAKSDVHSDYAEQLSRSHKNKQYDALETAFIQALPRVYVRDLLIEFLEFLKDLNEPERKGRIADFEGSKAFLAICMMVVVLDQMVTVLIANHAASHLDDRGPPLVLSIAERCCLAWFCVELLLKLWVHRLFLYFGDDWRMNWLDTFLVAYGLTEAVGPDLSFLRALRVFKMAKIVRMFKALTCVRDLRVIVDCLTGSFFTMFWGIVMVFFILYMFALVFVQAMVDYAIKNSSSLGEEARSAILLRFGSVEKGILSLFMALTGGFDWGEVYDLLELSGPVGTIACIFFVLLFTMSVWNIIGSIFVEKVMGMAELTPREKMEQQIIQHRVDAAEIHDFFAKKMLEFDEDFSGTISLADFDTIVEDGGLCAFMNVRDVELQGTADVDAFFRMAQESDRNAAKRNPSKAQDLGEDQVTLTSLVSTCLRVKGSAKRFELAVLRSELQRNLDVMRHALSDIRHAIHGANPERKLSQDTVLKPMLEKLNGKASQSYRGDQRIISVHPQSRSLPPGSHGSGSGAICGANLAPLTVDASFAGQRVGVSDSGGAGNDDFSYTL